MAGPILAVDFGAFQTSAALVHGTQWRPVTAPGTAGSWPAVGRVGAATDLAGAASGEAAGGAGGAGGVAGLEASTGGVAGGSAAATDTGAVALLAAALAPIGAEASRQDGARVERVALAGSRPAAPPGGPADSTLLAAGKAAGFLDVELVPAPVAAVLDPASGPDYPPGELVLVCALDSTWTTALVRVAGEHTTVRAWQVMPDSTGPDLATRLHWVVESGAKLTREVGVDPTGVVLTGDRIPLHGLADHLQPMLPAPIRPAAEPELAVLRGVIRWAASAGRRQLPAEPGRWRVEPLSWSIPGGAGKVLRWLVREGQPFAAGTVLAQVRSGTDRVYDLTARAEGALLAHRVAAGSRAGPSLVAAVAPAVASAAYDPPPHQHQWATSGGWLLTPRQLVEWDRSGSYVHSRSLTDGAVAGELRPDHGTGQPQQAGVFIDPAGRFCLITWDLEGEFWVWDIAAATLRSRFTGPAGARRILVNEGRWRLAAEDRDAVSVGRYRRTAVTFWDLDSGQRIDRLVADDWSRRHPGYAPRSAADRFTTEATSPDGRLRAGAADGVLTLHETATDRPVFRTTYPAPRDARTAFSADGRFLLAACELDDRSRVDVWQI